MRARALPASQNKLEQAGAILLAMKDLTVIRVLVMLTWSIVLLGAGGVMMWAARYGIIIRVWHLYPIIPGLGVVLGLTANWVRDELRQLP